jgi:cobalt/nickel transport system ATP-binding protein
VSEHIHDSDRVVDVRGLTYAYPNGVVALQDISLSVRAGERVALMGANGAGKSTLMLHLNGILRGHGQIEIAGLPLDDAHVRRIRALVGP